MEVAAAEVEDDLFFADLSKQISLLIMDDDDDDPLASCPSVSLHQAFSCAIHPPVQTQFLYEQSCRRESKGTGVFIPQQAQPRSRKHRQGRSFGGNSQYYYSKSQRQLQDNSKNKIMVSHHQQLPSNTTPSFKPNYSKG
ncbi:hypothetical protein TIFTF001_015807 [Ficus carica]|uniref:Uncharacterized protein n=1 Tax=Ficus carica TaxID=3494 RepID=A0AA88D875_FICCA|nr:hypothetical protein TIFTF001_015807 [Ficus carica]